MGIRGDLPFLPHRSVQIEYVVIVKQKSLDVSTRTPLVIPVAGRRPDCSRCSTPRNPAAGPVGSGSIECTPRRSSTRTRSDPTSEDKNCTGEWTSTSPPASVAPGSPRLPAETDRAAVRAETVPVGQGIGRVSDRVSGRVSGPVSGRVSGRAHRHRVGTGRAHRHRAAAPGTAPGSAPAAPGRVGE